MSHPDHSPTHSPHAPSDAQDEEDPSHLPVDPNDGMFPGSVPNDADQDGVIQPPR